MAINDVNRLIDMVSERIEEAKSPALKPNLSMVERDEILDLLDEMRAQLPVEIKRAQELLAAREKFVDEAKRDVERMMRQAELEAGQCLVGAHKDDMPIFINGIDARSFASQGQTRTAALSLKLGERDIFRQETGESPVLLLDDVLSELDAGRQDFVLNQITEGQVFITCCEPGRFTKLGQTVEIEKGKIIG